MLPRVNYTRSWQDASISGRAFQQLILHHWLEVWSTLVGSIYLSGHQTRKSLVGAFGQLKIANFGWSGIFNRTMWVHDHECWHMEPGYPVLWILLCGHTFWSNKHSETYKRIVIETFHFTCHRGLDFSEELSALASPPQGSFNTRVLSRTLTLTACTEGRCTTSWRLLLLHTHQLEGSAVLLLLFVAPALPTKLLSPKLPNPNCIL
jgi:hypothetical protein